MKKLYKKYGGHMKGQNKKKHILLPVVAVIVCVLLLVYFAVSFYFKSHFLFHTTINGLESSGYTVSKVEDEIADEIDSYVLNIQERGEKEENINGEDISLKPEFDGSLEKLMEEQNAFAWIGALFGKQEYTIDTMVTYDEEALQKSMEALSCVDSASEAAPVNAKISEYSETDGYTIIPAEYGTTVDDTALQGAVADAISNLADTLSLEEKGCYVDPDITEDSDSIKNAADTLNQYVNAKITYDFGSQSEVVDAELLKGWLSVSDAMEVNVNEDEIAAYVKSLAASYNTAGKAKNLTTSSGVSVTVPGGSYGWKIDQAAEREQLLSDIKSGGVIEREPEYAQTANSHGDNDYGNTYVDINLTTQHLNFYKNGALVISTDFVSGKVAEAHDTPTGAYFINSKETERTLRGPDYESFVNYWMPFNGDVGMHDATWRSSFGGTIYLRSGSHGCVNLPLSAAKTIYASIEVGDPVLVYQTEPTPSVTETVAPETIIAEIDSIGPVTLESQTIMTTIRTQYNALSDEDKAKVTNYDVLVADEATLAAMQATAPAPAE